jgi:hypothetical protein
VFLFVMGCGKSDISDKLAKNPNPPNPSNSSQCASDRAIAKAYDKLKYTNSSLQLNEEFVYGQCAFVSACNSSVITQEDLEDTYGEWKKDLGASYDGVVPKSCEELQGQYSEYLTCMQKRPIDTACVPKWMGKAGLKETEDDRIAVLGG